LNNSVAASVVVHTSALVLGANLRIWRDHLRTVPVGSPRARFLTDSTLHTAHLICRTLKEQCPDI
jgi:hypothetical protein